ncbi:hypothetical protein ACI2L1_27675 [Streptomyces sp. NPDC019531]|uniref:hypothetical protein n=1 Tax=Streptomyces sp. NPDC019531 TaxID=3365062 RepID=UPI0038503A37
MTSKPLMWTGVGLCGVGAATLVVVAFVDLGKADQVASVTGGIVALVGLALALIGQFGGSSTPPAAVSAPGDGSIAAGGNIGTASTGGTTPLPVPPTTPAAPTLPTGGVNASGKGAIAAGGDIGSASTGN